MNPVRYLTRGVRLNAGNDDVDQPQKTLIIVARVARGVTTTHHQVEHVGRGDVFAHRSRVDGQLAQHVDAAYQLFDLIGEF